MNNSTNCPARRNPVRWLLKRCWAMAVAAACLLAPAHAQQTVTVRGTVKDQSGMPVAGVTVLVKEGARGTTTDGRGNYILTGVRDSDVLLFSFLGYTAVETTVGQRTTIDITLEEDTHLVDEVVVVGFGSQKRVNLTGAVGTADSKVLESRPVQNAAQALQGVVPGLNITQLSGELGSTPSINIRGVATIGEGSTGSPLVLIDGMEGDINSINPQEIESISVLKDASSSSIYGSRAPFGVILITTKKGQAGQVRINYNNSLRFDSPSSLPKMMDSYSFALMFNDAAVNGGQTTWFNEAHLQRILDFQNGDLELSVPSDGDFWVNTFYGGNANTEWFSELYKSWVFSQEHNLSVNGGTEAVRYYLSGNFLDKEGFMNHGGDDFKRYSFTGKLDAKLNNYISASYTSRITRQVYSKPYYLHDGFYQMLGPASWPTMPVTDPNGYYFSSSGHNHAHTLAEGGRSRRSTDDMSHQLQVIATPLAGWRIVGEGNFRKVDWTHSEHMLPLYNHDIYGNSYWYYRNTTSMVNEGTSRSNYYNANVYTDYTKSIDKHNFKAMVGIQAEKQTVHQIWAKREGIIVPGYNTLPNTSGTDPNGSTVPPEVIGADRIWSTAGFFGRLNYDYDGRYLIEGSLRYDGSSRFRKNDRWKWLPSFSMGWNVAREEFWKPIESKINMLKPRFSYGTLGNQNTNDWYPTYPQMTLGAANGDWLINGGRPNTANAPALISSQLTWEKVKTSNYGIDIGAFNNRLTTSFDYFVRKTLDMIGPAQELPAILGTAVPKFNNTDLKTWGFEFEIAWQDRLKNGLGYRARFVLSDSRTKITRYPNPTGNLATYYEGQIMGTIWGYQTIGIARSQDEMNTHLATLPGGGQDRLGSQWGAGDIMFADLNGDDKIDNGANTLDDHGDLKIIGNNMPRFEFGLDLNLDWKGIDMRIFFQGVGKRDYYRTSWYFYGIYNDMWTSTGLTQHKDYFRENADHPLGQNLDSYYPRPLFGTTKNQQAQTKYLHNAAYIRLKNIQLGYTIPRNFSRKFGVQSLRVYVSAENLWTGTSLTKIFDPETIASTGNYGGLGYPLTKSVAFGINVNF